MAQISNTEKIERKAGKNSEKNSEKSSEIPKMPGPFGSIWILIPCFYLFCVIFGTWFMALSQTEEIPYSTFMKHVDNGRVETLLIERKQILGKYKSGKYKMFTTQRIEDPDLLKRLSAKNIEFEGKTDDGFWDFLPWIIAPVLFFTFLSILSAKAAGKDGMAVRQLVTEALDHALTLLKKRRRLLEEAANLLLQKETLTQEDLQRLSEGPAGKAA